MPNKRDKSIDIAKGILIMLMVIGHSGCPSYLGSLIYSFHMPCFFVISGMLLSDKYFDKSFLFVRKRIKGLYKPFVKWSLIFLLFHNIFFKLHLYDVSFTWHEFINKIFHIITLTGSEQLLGGFWFLKELLYASIIGFFVISCTRKHHPKSTMLMVCLFLILAFIQSECPYKIPTIGSKTYLATSYYILGYLLKTSHIFDSKNYYLFLFVSLVFLMIPYIYTGNMDTVGVGLLIYYPLSLLGSLLTVTISKRLVMNVHLCNILCKIGQATLYILIFHFISFKIVSFLLILVGSNSLMHLSDFPVLDTQSRYCWVLYSVVGITIPYLIWSVKEKWERHNLQSV